MVHTAEDCNGGHGCSGPDCCCPCHFDELPEEEDEYERS